ncbi:MAG: HlyD family efflux transporter periplasmic adaptor subunit [Candidatus Latescibacteria bacterium]|nr:HlyD family efflux transporter periplasmic adaptor subunit [Candidatus Latescibacterota bacterium]NIM65811.1 HlyD family efflux transporter periplasmic adaptor subunit [Candidatus Latescibacterota bacterium]NIO02303.1 HlyD family efflux transporter periplasmic adaptor subunit [Candidatus Latescibacterota bacterium]NIO29174.1 HlyD family efflux transporter periplasmic adaptor subunit [Candidatus Latescibacterota bacterium]NIO56789.1 HlyD family efflux transporter periplasmic adaptor subunit [
MDRMIEKKRWSWRTILLIGGAGLILLIIVGRFIDAGGGRRLRVPAERIEVATVELGEFQEYIPVTGSVIPMSTHYVDAIRGGVVEEAFVEEGSIVEAGDSILRLSNTDLLLDIMYREAELYSQSNNLRNTIIAMEENRLRMLRELLDVEHEIARQRRLTKNATELAHRDLISRDDYEEAREELEYLMEKRRLLAAMQRQDSLYRAEQVHRIQESLARMQSNLDMVRGNLNELIVRAPVSGRLTSLNAEVGQVKSSGERLGQIDVLSGFKVRASVDEYHVARVGKGQPASLELSGNTFALAVEKVYPRVISGRFDIDLCFVDGEPEGLRRGRTVHLRLELGETAQALLLQMGGFFHDTSGRWVYLLDEEGKTACRHQITVGRKNPRSCEVLGGLAEGDRVIVSSYERFGEADRVVLE